MYEHHKSNTMSKSNLVDLEKQAIERMKATSKRSLGVTNKTILFELLTNGEYDRNIAPVKAATLYFTKTNVQPTKGEYEAKVKSIKNSLDTMVSDYNSETKIKNDHLLHGTTLVRKANNLTITK